MKAQAYLYIFLTFLVLSCTVADTEEITPGELQPLYGNVNGPGNFVHQLDVISLDISQDFYMQILGLTMVPGLEDPKFFSVVRLLKAADNTNLWLSNGRVKIIETDYRKTVKMYFKIPKDSMKKWVAYLKSYNIKTTEVTQTVGSSKTYINDPDGYVIEFSEIK